MSLNLFGRFFYDIGAIANDEIDEVVIYFYWLGIAKSLNTQSDGR